MYIRDGFIHPSPSVSDVVAALKQCTTSRDLETGARIHKLTLQHHAALHHSIYISNTLLDMYAKCGDLPKAQILFHSITSPTVVSWNSIILGHADVGEGATALELFARMQNHGFKPDARTFVSVFKALATLGKRTPENRPRWLKLARAVHSQATDSGHGENIFVGNTLVDMYGKLGNMLEAHKVFDNISNKSTVSWNALIMGYVEADEGSRAVELFEEMQKLGFRPNDLTYTAAIKACASSAVKEQVKLAYLEKGREIHNKVLCESREIDMFLGSTLVDMYSKCGAMEEARKVFNIMKLKDMVCYSTLIMGYAENGEGEQALKLFTCMEKEGFHPDSQAFLGAIKACANLGLRQEGESSKAQSLERGRELQLQLGELGYQDDVFLAGALVDMFAKCGSLVEAQGVFNRTRRSLDIWNSILQAYAECGEGQLALQQFERMQEEGFSPDSRTYIALINACTSSATRDKRLSYWLQTGAKIHKRAEKDGLETEVYVANSLLDMYIKCGSVGEAERVFKNMKKRSIVSWNTLILGHAEAGDYEQVFTLFQDMQREGLIPESRTYVGVFKACSAAAQVVIKDVETNQATWKWKCLEKTRDFHVQFARSGEAMDVFVASSLVEAYSRCGSMSEARIVLEEYHRHKGGELESMAWTGLISGYVENGEEGRALESFHLMKERGVRAHSGAFVVCLTACGVLTCLESGRELHGEVCARGTESEPVVATSLIDFYGKCGVMEKARLVFDSMQQHGDIVTWNALLTGYAQLGHTEDVFELLSWMKHGQEAVQPNSVTFLCALAACSHSGLVDEGVRVFRRIQAPRVEHYSCMVDMLCRANKLEKALEMVKSMPAEANSRIWTTILDAANKFGNHKVGKLAFESRMKMEQYKEDAATFVLMSNTLRQR